MTAPEIILIVVAYLLGSVSTAIITCRLLGLPDPRTEGSCNPGATNVLRIGGKKAAAMTLAGDVLKGVLPVLAGRLAGFDAPVLALAAGAAFIGHLYPLFFGFRGGKGVATAFGALTTLMPLVGLALVATWLLMAKVFRISSLSALTAALLAPVFVWALEPQPAYLMLVGGTTLLLVWRHRSNIRNLLERKEGQIGR